MDVVKEEAEEPSAATDGTPAAVVDGSAAGAAPAAVEGAKEAAPPRAAGAPAATAAPPPRPPTPPPAQPNPSNTATDSNAINGLVFIALDSARGVLYVSEQGNHRVRYLDLSGPVTYTS